MTLKGLARTRAFWGFTGVAGLMLHLFEAQPIYSAWDRLLAWVLLAVFLWVTRSYVMESSRKIPLLPLVTLQIYVMYGMAQFTQKEILVGPIWYTPPRSAIHAAILLVVAGEAGMLLLFKLGERATRRWKRSWPALYPSSLLATKSAAIAYGLLGILWYFIQNAQAGSIPIEIRNVLQAVLNPYLALIIILYWSRHSRERNFKIMGVVMVCAMVLSGMISSMLEIILVPVYLLIMADWIWGRVLRAKLVVAAIVFFVLLSPVKYHYRNLALDAPPVQSIGALLERVAIWKQAIKRTWDDPFAKEKSIEAASNRTSALLSLAQVIDWVPQNIPYNKGEGFATSVFYWVPRIFWKSKPSISDLINNRYAIAFGYSTPEGVRKSTIGICQPADGYWDWGATGALGYLMIYGLFLGVLFGETGKGNEVANVVVIVFSASFFQNLVSLQFMIANLFSLFVGAWLALNLLGLANAVLHRNRAVHWERQRHRGSRVTMRQGE